MKEDNAGKPLMTRRQAEHILVSGKLCPISAIKERPDIIYQKIASFDPRPFPEIDSVISGRSITAEPCFGSPCSNHFAVNENTG